jgi:PAS domain-containing protein
MSSAAASVPVFILDVVVTLWRRDTAEARRMALVVGGPVLVSVVLAQVLSQVVIWRVAELPILVVPPFVIALGAMALEVSRDVLLASRLARELRESEQRLTLAASSAGAGLWTWDSSSMHVWATGQARAMLGLDQTADIHPADVLRVVDPADVHELSDAFRAALKRGGEHALLFRTVTPGGTPRWIAAQGTVELDAGGQPTLVRGVFKPPVLTCPLLTVQPRSVSQGRKTVIKVLVTRAGKAVPGVRILVAGPGLRKVSTTDSRGRVAITVRPPKAGIVTVRMAPCSGSHATSTPFRSPPPNAITTSVKRRIPWSRWCRDGVGTAQPYRITSR